jgi:hypothetical protein
MKKVIKLLALSLAMLLFISGCGTLEDGLNTGNKPGTNSDTDSKDNGDETSMSVFEAEVIQAEGTLLVTPDEESSEYRSSDKIAVSLQGVIVDKQGNEITLKELKAGDRVSITYNGIIAESYPAQISASEVKVTGHNLLIDGYLALIDDIYQEDDGLNSDITMIALDTTGWAELTDIEKEIIFAEMKEIYGVDIIEGTFDELAEQELIDKETLYFPEGILITISDIKYDKEKEEITCSIEKWRSGLGAIGSNDVTAKYKDGKWSITKEGMWIS